MSAPQTPQQPQPSRKDLMKPVQLLGFAVAAAVFAGVIGLFAMGFFQEISDEQRQHVLVVTFVVAGIAFIATLVIIALLMLAVDPAQLTKQVDEPVLHPGKDAQTDAEADGQAGAGKSD